MRWRFVEVWLYYRGCTLFVADQQWPPLVTHFIHFPPSYNWQLTLNLLRGGCSRARRKGESRECGVLPGLELMAKQGSGAFCIRYSEIAHCHCHTGGRMHWPPLPSCRHQLMYSPRPSVQRCTARRGQDTEPVPSLYSACTAAATLLGLRHRALLLNSPTTLEQILLIKPDNITITLP